LRELENPEDLIEKRVEEVYGILNATLLTSSAPQLTLRTSKLSLVPGKLLQSILM
jgi:hypothetical protein